MIIAQISDMHIGFDGKGAPCENTARLEKVVEAIRSMQRKPDLVIATGDLVEHGEHWAYENLKKALGYFKVPVHLCLGNHDSREAFQDIFPEIEFDEGFLQYTIEDYEVRVIVLDTLEEGRHGGSFCEARANWLRRKLDEQPDRPTLIALHHPPIHTGINWMTADPSAEWVNRLKGVIQDYDNVTHMIAGHIHRAIFKKFAGTTISVTQAIAPQVKLELDELDLDVPDGRALLVEARPGFCLHQWDNGTFITHSAQAPCGKTILNYSKKFAFVPRHTLDADH